LKLNAAFEYGTPPQALEPEQIVLGALLVDNTGRDMRAAREQLTADDFYRDAHKRIFEAACALADRGETTELPLVADELERRAMLEFVGGRLYLAACVQSWPRGDLGSYLQRIRETSIRRSLIGSAGELIGACYNGHSMTDLGGSAAALAALAGSVKSAPRATSRTLGAEEMMRMQLPAPEWAVPGILPEGLTILSGRPKTGKSWFLLQLGLAVGGGGWALGQINVETGPVLYLALEDTLRRLQSRMALLLGESPAPEHLHLAVQCPQMGQGGIEELEGWIYERKPRLVMVDTLGVFRGVPDPRAAVYYGDSEAIGSLKRLADRYHTSMLVSHHQRKGRADDVHDTVSGSLGLTGRADGSLVLERKRGEDFAILHVTGRDIEEADLGLSWEPHSAWNLRGDAALFQRRQEAIEVLLLITEERAFLRAQDLVDHLGLSHGAARQRLSRLEQGGQLVRVAPGLYAASPAKGDCSANSGE
jgi:hypothetical protein